MDAAARPHRPPGLTQPSRLSEAKTQILHLALLDFLGLHIQWRRKREPSQWHALDNFVWWRLIRMIKARHRWRWQDVRRHFTTPSGQWRSITAPDGTELFKMATTPVTRYRRRSAIPNQWTPQPA